MVEQNYYFDVTKESRPYTHTLEATEGSLSPTNALRLEPEFKDGYWPCEKDGQWIQIEDYRGQAIYSIADPMSIKIVEKLGAIEEGYTLLQPEQPWSVWDGSAWQTGDMPIVSISKRQLKLALAKNVVNVSLKSVIDKVNAMQEYDLPRIEWEESTDFKKDNDFIAWFASEYQVDVNDLFKKSYVY